MVEQITKNPIFCFGVFVVAVCIILFIQNLINKSSPDVGTHKKMLRQLVNKHIPDGESYEMVYASYWQRKGMFGRNNIYYYFCVAFRPWECVVIPIKSVSRKKVVLGDANYFTKDNVAKVYCNEIGEVTGFIDKDGKHMMGYAVNPVVDSAVRVKCPFDIDQNLEYREYYQFIKAFAHTINVKKEEQEQAHLYS